MSERLETAAPTSMPTHRLGVIAGLVAGVWLGAAEAPTKLVTLGLSPFTISLCMVAGVFTARWTFPTLLKGTTYVWADLMSKKHLIVWALLAGALWAVANTLTVFAIRDVGLAIAFPLWNANTLVGLLWGRVLFGELKGASTAVTSRVMLGAVATVAAAILLGFSSIHGGAAWAPLATTQALHGIAAALGACLLWGTMYVPYRKAYLSGMNPLSFVTAFTVGELATVGILTLTLGGGLSRLRLELLSAHGVLFSGCFLAALWVVGDLFQQFAAKYLGIGRGIPLSNTNQLWGLAWAALVFHELAGADRVHQLLVVAGSLLMIAGSALIGSAASSKQEDRSRDEAILRECERYGMDFEPTLASMRGEARQAGEKRRWWDYLIIAAATSVFIYLGVHARIPLAGISLGWMLVLGAVLLVSLAVGSYSLWKTTRFS